MTRHVPLIEHLLQVLDPLPARNESRPGCRSAAVLVPLLLDLSDPELLLTRRTEEVETHKGQISFPGGVCDDGDRDPAWTALRETEEELGIGRDVIRIAGALPELRTPTGFCITPVVGLIEQLPDLTPNSAEVAEVFRVPLGIFAGGRSEIRVIEGKGHEVWFFDHRGMVIWGATAAIARTLWRRCGPLP